MRTLTYCIALLFFFFSTLTLHAQEIDIPSKYGSASTEAKELMKKNNVTLSEECGNLSISTGKTKLTVTDNALFATTNGGTELLLFSYKTYRDSVTVYKLDPKTQKFVVQLQSTELKELNFDDCNCDEQYKPAEQLKSFAKVLQIADHGQWFDVHKLGGYEYWTIRYYEEGKKTKGFVKPRSMRCCSTDFTQN